MVSSLRIASSPSRIIVYYTVGEKETAMSYISTSNNQPYHVASDEEMQHITIEGKEYALDWRRIAPLAADAKGNVSAGGRFSLLLGGISYDVFARRIPKADEKNSQTYEVTLGSQRFEVKVEDERAKLLAGLVKTGTVSGEAVVSAPMPGLVVGVPFEVGATISQGQTVVVLEAMKMENDLSSPISGIIKEIRVNTGQTVDQGDVLFVVSAEVVK